MNVKPSVACATGVYFWAILTPGRNFERVFHEGRVLDLLPMENPFAFMLAGSIVLAVEVIPRIPQWLSDRPDVNAKPVLDFLAWVKPAIEKAFSGAYKAAAAFVAAITERIKTPSIPAPNPFAIPTLRISGRQEDLAAAIAKTVGQGAPTAAFAGGGAPTTVAASPEPKAPPTSKAAVKTDPPPSEPARNSNIPDGEFKLSPLTRDLIRPTRLRVARGETGLVEPYVRRLGGGRSEANYLGFFVSGPEAKIRAELDEFAKEARMARVGWELPNTLDLTAFCDKRKKTAGQAIKSYVADLRPNTLDETTVGPLAPYPVERISCCGFIWGGEARVLSYRELAAFVATARGARAGAKSISDQVELSDRMSPLESLTDFLIAATGTRKRKDLF